MKRIMLILVVIFIFMLMVGLIYLRLNAPLIVNGISFYEDEENKRVIEVVNNGFSDIEIKNVTVNGDTAQSVEVGLSTTNHILAGSGLDTDSNITFHNINEQKIKPKLLVGEQSEINSNENSAKNYGLRIYGKEAPKNLVIEYTYLFMPFSLKVDVTENNE